MSVKTGPRFDASWILVILLTTFAVAPLAYPGFFEAQSGFLPAFNASHLSAAPDWGRLDEPLRGEGKLPYLLVWPIYQLSGSGVVAVKWGYGLAFLLGALGVHAWTRRWLGAKGGVLAAVVYTYLPWHLSTVYVRGAYAEAWLWAFWPPLLWAIDRALPQARPGEGRPGGTAWAIATGLVLLAATLWTQPGLAVLAIPLLAAYGVLVPFRWPWPLLRLVEALAVSLLLLGVAARRLPEARIPFADHFLSPFQLLSAAWGDGISFQLGIAAVCLSMVALALWVLRRGAGAKEDGATEEEEEEGLAEPSQIPSSWAGTGARPYVPASPVDRDTGFRAATGARPYVPANPVDRDTGFRAGTGARPYVPANLLDRAMGFWAGTLLLLVLLGLPLSGWFWKITAYNHFLTYPWQLLALSGLPLAFLAGSVIRLDRRLATLPAWAGLVALVVLASYPYLSPRFTQVDPGPEPSALFQPVEADAPQILLLESGAALSGDITPTLALTLTWQVVEPVAADYTLFIHVLDEDGTKVAQRDTRPCDGECPTTAWQPGQIVVDRYELDLPARVASSEAGAAPQAPSGRYRLAMGLYLLDTGERAMVVGQDDRTVYVDVPE